MMIHNYYLYEKDGQMQMIPWDYNLAFGGFQSMGGATGLVNFPIDTPVAAGTVSDNNGQIQPQGGNAAFEPLIAVGISVLVLALGLMFAFTYKRRK